MGWHLKVEVKFEETHRTGTKAQWMEEHDLYCDEDDLPSPMNDWLRARCSDLKPVELEPPEEDDNDPVVVWWLLEVKITQVENDGRLKGSAAPDVEHGQLLLFPKGE